MSEYLIFDQDYLDIPLQDLPGVGDYVVCKDLQHRLNNSIEKNETWAVVEIVGEEVPPKAHGLFWEKELAVSFAKALIAKFEPLRKIAKIIDDTPEYDPNEDSIEEAIRLDNVITKIGDTCRYSLP